MEQTEYTVDNLLSAIEAGKFLEAKNNFINIMNEKKSQILSTAIQNMRETLWNKKS